MLDIGFGLHLEVTPQPVPGEKGPCQLEDNFPEKSAAISHEQPTLRVAGDGSSGPEKGI